MSLNNVLKNSKDIQFTISTTLNNTVTQEWGFEDMLGGAYSSFGGTSFNQINYLSNAEIKISNKAALNCPSHEVVAGGLTLVQSLDGKFDTSVSSTYATVSILNTRTSDDFSLRSWKDRVFDVRVGGILNFGQSSQETLVFNDYPVWFRGVIDDYTVNDSSIDLSMSLLPSKLKSHAPVNTFRSGDSEGRPIPYIIGSVKGFSPARVGDGIFKFHDGNVETTDAIQDKVSGGYDLFPAISIGQEKEYYHSLSLDKFTDAGSEISVTTLSWSEASPNKFEESSVLDGAMSISPLLDVEISGNDLVVTNPKSDLEKYTFSDFFWREDDGKLISNKGLPTEVFYTSGISVDQSDQSFFKLETSTSGTVTIKFPKVIRELEMVIRNIDLANRNVDNWSIDPDSISPPFEVGVETNHKVVFSSLNSDSISFDYSSTTIDKPVAIWFNELQTYSEVVGEFSYVSDNELNLTVIKSDLSQLVGDDESNASVLSFDISNVKTESLSIGGGSVILRPKEYKTASITYQAILDKDSSSIKMNPSPILFEGQGGVPLVAQSELPVLQSQSSTAYEIICGIKITSDDPDIQNVEAIISIDDSDDYPLGFPTKVNVTRDLKEFKSIVTSEDIGLLNTTRLYVRVARGAATDVTSPLALRDNPDGEFILHVEYIRAIPIDGVSENIKVFASEGGTRVSLKTYRVSNALRYKGLLPKGLALYDSLGNLCVSPEYISIVGDFNGEEESINLIDACRKISKIASDEDFILTDLTESPQVGYPLSEQKPAIEHIGDILLNTDHFYQESLDTNDVKIIKRYDAKTYPSDFKAENLISGSVSRIGSEPREQQYVVEYDRDFTDSSLSKYSRSDFGSLSELDTRTLSTALKYKDDADYIASLIIRDSSRNGEYQFSDIGVGLDRNVGDAGIVSHEDVPRNRPAIIKSITESTQPRETKYIAKVLEAE